MSEILLLLIQASYLVRRLPLPAYDKFPKDLGSHDPFSFRNFKTVQDKTYCN